MEGGEGEGEKTRKEKKKEPRPRGPKGCPRLLIRNQTDPVKKNEWTREDVRQALLFLLRRLLSF